MLLRFGFGLSYNWKMSLLAVVENRCCCFDGSSHADDIRIETYHNSRSTKKPGRSNIQCETNKEKTVVRLSTAQVSHMIEVTQGIFFVYATC